VAGQISETTKQTTMKADTEKAQMFIASCLKNPMYRRKQSLIARKAGALCAKYKDCEITSQ